MHNSFGVNFKGGDLGRFHLFVPGVHNILNATAAIAVGMGLEIPVERIREGIAQFRGVDRRFQNEGRGRRGDEWWTTTAITRPRFWQRLQPPGSGWCANGTHSRHLPAPPLHPHLSADG